MYTKIHEYIYRYRLYILEHPKVMRFKNIALNSCYGMRRWFSPRWERSFRPIFEIAAIVRNLGSGNTGIEGQQGLGDSSILPYIIPKLVG